VLLEAGADVNANDEPRIGNTALRYVAQERSLARVALLKDVADRLNASGF